MLCVFYRRYGKRGLDLLLSTFLLVVLAPLQVIVILTVRRRLGKPVFFRQIRAGMHGKLFELVKFRTMRDARDAAGELLPDGDRLDKFGSWMRSTSIDELPELWNVIRGDMSLVGPRPLLEEYLPLYSPMQARRHELRPGITGWAQIHGRNAISWSEKFELDVWYVDHVSFMTDVKVMWRTFATAISRSGVNAPDGGSMPPFTG